MRAVSFIFLLAALAVVGAWFMVRDGFSTRTPPGEAEAFVARHMRNWSQPSHYKTLPNPVVCTPVALSESMAHWADHCATCHSNNGDGKTMLGKTMYPRPPDMREQATQTQTDGELYYTIKNGVRLTGMPAFGEPGDTDLDSWKLVCFVRHLPLLTPEETDKMKTLNPKTPEDLEEERREAEFLSGATVQAPDEHKHQH